jgi:glycosyltransferase involved in cell wall biosynthesis
MSGAPVQLSIIVPAFNEAANLAPVVQRTSAALRAADWLASHEIVVVDDGSSDGTGAVADGLASSVPGVRVVHHERNRGFGAAIRSGYTRATGEYCVAIPSDGEVEVEQALALFRAMGDADVMVSRRERSGPMPREVFTTAWHMLMRAIVGADLRGMDGIYVIRTSLLREMSLRSNTGLVNLEILMHCAKRGVRMRSGIMQASPRLSGESKVANVRTMATITWEMLKLRLSSSRSAR